MNTLAHRCGYDPQDFREAIGQPGCPWYRILSYKILFKKISKKYFSTFSKGLYWQTFSKMIISPKDFDDSSAVAHPFVLLLIVVLWSAIFFFATKPHPKKTDSFQTKYPLPTHHKDYVPPAQSHFRKVPSYNVLQVNYARRSPQGMVWVVDSIL